MPSTLKRIIPKTKIQSRLRIKALQMPNHGMHAAAFPLIIRRPQGFPVGA
jgi:hypothetical protein